MSLYIYHDISVNIRSPHFTPRVQSHVVSPPFRCQQLIEPRIMREAAGKTRALHGLHHPEEGLLVHQGCTTISSSFAGWNTVFFEAGGIKVVHRAHLLGSSEWMVAAEQEVRTVSELLHITLVFNVDSPYLT